jgi:hypothetical protein
MADRTIAIAFAPGGSTVSIHTGTNPDTFAVAQDSNGDGYIPQQIDDGLGDSTIKIDAPGYKPYAVHFKFRNSRDNANEPKPLNQQVNVGSDIPALIKLGPPPPPPGQLPSLRTSGRDFVTPDGKREVLIGTDEFLAFRHWLSGADLAPFFAESRELGFNLWRVFFQGSKAQNGVLQLSPTEPGYYEHVRPFAELLNANGIVLLAVIGVDNQDIQSPPEHWTRMYREFDGLKVIASKANEWGKNLAGLRPDQLPNPTNGVLWSQGSGLQDEAPFRPTGPVMEFHPVRNYTTTMRDAVASAIELFEVQNYGNVRLLYDEPGRMGDIDPSPAEFANPKHCWEYARIATSLAAGIVFHNRNGQSGQLMSEGTKACAREFVRGARID